MVWEIEFGHYLANRLVGDTKSGRMGMNCDEGKVGWGIAAWQAMGDKIGRV